MAFRITRVTATHVRMPLVHPFETSFGLEEVKDSVLVRVTADGIDGWGESPVHARPFYSADDVTTVWHVLRDHVGPWLVGRSLRGPADLPADLGGVRGHRFARAGVECAVADVAARVAGLPLHRYWGATRSRIPVGVSIGIQPTVDDLVERVAGFVARGYGRVKIKIKPGWEVEPLEAIRARFPDLMLYADANAAYTLGDADVLASLDRFDLALIEQPLAHDDLVDHARLQARMRTPVCLDESLAGLAASRAAIRLGAAGAINIKIPRMGGPVDSRRLAAIARRLGIPVFCGGMLETGVGRAHNMALAALDGFSLPGDISASDRYWAQDLVEPAATLDDDGCLALSDRPGLGVDVVESRVDACAVDRLTFEA